MLNPNQRELNWAGEGKDFRHIKVIDYTTVRILIPIKCMPRRKKLPPHPPPRHSERTRRNFSTLKINTGNFLENFDTPKAFCDFKNHPLHVGEIWETFWLEKSTQVTVLRILTPQKAYFAASKNHQIPTYLLTCPNSYSSSAWLEKKTKKCMMVYMPHKMHHNPYLLKFNVTVVKQNLYWRSYITWYVYYRLLCPRDSYAFTWCSGDLLYLPRSNTNANQNAPSAG